MYFLFKNKHNKMTDYGPCLSIVAYREELISRLRKRLYVEISQGGYLFIISLRDIADNCDRSDMNDPDSLR